MSNPTNSDMLERLFNDLCAKLSCYSWHELNEPKVLSSPHETRLLHMHWNSNMYDIDVHIHFFLTMTSI